MEHKFKQMKTICIFRFYASVLVLAVMISLLVACNREQQEEMPEVIPDNTITMTTQSSMVGFSVVIPFGTDILVDWGDGTEICGINDADYPPEFLDEGIGLRFTRNYTPNMAWNCDTEHRITITGTILRLGCESNQLTALDVRGAPGLSWLRCSSNQLTTLDVGRNTKLTYLECSGNLLTELDLSRHADLIELGCSNNQLTTLDVNGATALYWLYCDYNQLSTLDTNGNPCLRELNCYENQLTKLDMSNNTSLIRLHCQKNQLTTSALNALFITLPLPMPNNPSYTKGNLTYIYSLWISDNPGTSDCDVSIALERGWAPHLSSIVDN